MSNLARELDTLKEATAPIELIVGLTSNNKEDLLLNADAFAIVMYRTLQQLKKVEQMLSQSKNR
ncbi:hypothetical protein VH441_07235 [Psychrobacter sp. HD31]|uniref:hypothetical protein n=1 Tax=Psychrobacter sp. HD31 TaxID=3112003 RepID=UPI003DA373BF